MGQNVTLKFEIECEIETNTEHGCPDVVWLNGLEITHGQTIEDILRVLRHEFSDELMRAADAGKELRAERHRDLEIERELERRSGDAG